MAAIINPGSPIEFQLQQQDLERQRALAQALQQQSMQAPEGQMVSGHYVAPHAMQYIAKLAQGLLGASQQTDLDQRQLDLASRQNKFMGDQASILSKALTENPEDNAAIVNYLNATGNSGKAVDYVIGDAKQKALIAALTGASPSSATQPSQSATGAGNSLQAAPSGSVPSMPSMGTPAPTTQAAPSTPQQAFQMLPSEQKQIVMGYLKAGKPDDAIKAMQDYLKPHVTADGRVVQMRNGNVVVPDGSVQAYEQFTRSGKQFDGPIALNTESGATVQLSPTEWADYQKSGKLPFRFLPAPIRDGIQQDIDASGVEGNVNIKTPQGVVGGVVSPRIGISQTTAGKQQAEKQGTFFGDTYADLQKKAMASNDQIGKYQRLNQLLEGVETGKFSGTALEIKKAAKAAGFDLGVQDNVAPLEAARALTSEMALIARNPDSGMGMPGAMSDADRAFLVNMQPGIETTSEGRKLMVSAAIKMEQRKQEIAQLARQYKGGQLDNGFFQVVQDYANAHPLFADMAAPKPAQPTTGGAPNGGPVDYQKLYGIKRK